MKYSLQKYYIVVRLFIACVFCISTSISPGWTNSSGFHSIPSSMATQVADESTITEGPVTTVVFTAGPFDLHRRYLSMEGPWVVGQFTPADMFASKNIELPEGMVHFLENGRTPASMMGTSKGSAIQQPIETDQPIGLVHAPKGPRELYWFKGVKLEVLDENEVVQPTAEFICHWNLDVEPNFRNRVFTEGHYTPNPRLSSISQGETLQILPRGYAVPIASDEPLHLSFQAANRTTDTHRRIKHRCTLYFIKDKDLYYPLKALYFYVPYLAVVADKNTPELSQIQKKSCPICVGTSEGVDAPNDKIGGTFRDSADRVLSPHWVIPPGIHTYHDLIGTQRDANFQKGNPIIRAAWTHVHPLCSKLSLVECTRNKRLTVLSTNCVTKTTPGLQIMHLDFLTPKGGVQLHESSQYELEVTYNNTLPKAVDSMASMGIYMEDQTFARPRWAMHDYKPEAESDSISTTSSIQNQEIAMSCAITNPQCNKRYNNTNPKLSRMSLFDINQDGPLLTEAKIVELETNAGPIILNIDPVLAPITATHMYRLLSSDAFIGTRIFRYQANYYLQIANAEDKAAGQLPLLDKSKNLLRYVALEISNQKYNKLSHPKYALSMTRFENVPDSATSSFLILLKDAPEIDHKDAVFGRMGEDATTLETLAKIEKNWDSNRYWITGSKIVKSLANINN